MVRDAKRIWGCQLTMDESPDCTYLYYSGLKICFSDDDHLLEDFKTKVYSWIDKLNAEQLTKIEEIYPFRFFDMFCVFWKPGVDESIELGLPEFGFLPMEYFYQNATPQPLWFSNSSNRIWTKDSENQLWQRGTLSKREFKWNKNHDMTK